MQIRPKETGIVITDPQNDFLSPEGVTWGLVGQSVTDNGTVEHIEQLLKAAKEAGFESHLRELLEHGFEVTVVKDATAAAISPELGDGYAAALTNYGFIANAVVTTDEAVTAIKGTLAAH